MISVNSSQHSAVSIQQLKPEFDNKLIDQSTTPWSAEC